MVLPNIPQNDVTGISSSYSTSEGARGSWGSHLSTLQTIIDLGLGSALVLEDDVDWDVRLKAQMQTFARASQMWLDRQQHKGSSLGLLAASPGTAQADTERDPISLPQYFPSFDAGYKYHRASPYGEDWDVLWLGHCGADLPSAQQETHPGTHTSSSSSSSLLKIIIANDTTVPAPKHLQPHPFALHDALADAYPAHTRIMHAARGNVCSLAYAVSQSGARKLLRRFSKDGFTAQWDSMLRDYCTSEQTGHSEQRGRREEEADRGSLICLTVQPPLISHRYVQEGGASVSDISGQGGGFARTKTGSPYIRLSVQSNLDRLLAGYSENRLVDQLPGDGNLLW